MSVSFAIVCLFGTVECVDVQGDADTGAIAPGEEAAAADMRAGFDGREFASDRAQRHGGELDIASELGKVSTFKLVFPALRVRLAAEATTRPAARREDALDAAS